MTGLPSGWRASIVADAGRLDLGRQRHPDWHHGPEMRPYLRVANVFEDRIDTSDLKEMDFSGVFDRYRLESGDVLLNEGQSPELLGRPAIYRGVPAQVAFTNTLIRFRPHNIVMPEWALIVFRHHMRSGRFSQEARITTNIAHLSLARLKSVEFPIPPFSEQHRIVDLVEDHLSRVAAAEQYLSAGRDRATMLMSLELEAKLANREGQVLSLGEILDEPLSNGRSVPTAEEGFPVLRLTCLKGNRVDLTGRKIGAWRASDAASFLVRKGDFLVARGNGSLRLVGRGGLVEEEPDQVAFPDTLIRIRPRTDIIDPQFLSIAWNAPSVRRQIEAAARTTAGIYKVNQKDLRRIVLPIPSIEDQRRIVSGLNAISSSIGRFATSIEVLGKRAKLLRNSVLSAAVNGLLNADSAHPESPQEVADV